MPALITCGRYDEIGPSCAATLETGIPDARTVVFEQSAHLAHVEDRHRYKQVVGEFLRAHDRPAGPTEGTALVKTPSRTRRRSRCPRRSVFPSRPVDAAAA